MSWYLAALAVISLVDSACASFTHASGDRFRPPAIQVDYPDIAMPTVDFIPSGVPEPTLALQISTEPPTGPFCEGLILPEPLRPYGTTWRVRSISSPQTSERASLTEAERFFADWYGGPEQPMVVFHLKAASP